MRSRQDKSGRKVAITHGDLEGFERAVLARIDENPQTDSEGERDHPQAHIAFEPASDAADQREARLRPRRVATLVERSQRSHLNWRCHCLMPAMRAAPARFRTAAPNRCRGSIRHDAR